MCLGMVHSSSTGLVIDISVVLGRNIRMLLFSLSVLPKMKLEGRGCPAWLRAMVRSNSCSANS